VGSSCGAARLAVQWVVLASTYRTFSLAYHCHNANHVLLLLGTGNIKAYFQDTGLPGCFAGWQVYPYLPISHTSAL